MYGDKKSVLYNTTLPESTLKKKSNYIAYHAVIKGAVNGEWLPGYYPTDTNISNLLTYPAPDEKRNTRLVWGVMYYI